MEDIIKTAEQIREKFDTFTIKTSDDLKVLVSVIREAQEFLKKLTHDKPEIIRT